MGERATRFLPLFKDVDVNLRRSGVKISFRAYVSLAVFATLLLSASFLVSIPLVLVLAFHLSPPISLLLGVGVAMLVGAFTTIGFYIYPLYRADNLKRSLEDGLTFITGYMAVLSGAGVSPEHTFHSLAQIDLSPIVTAEARTLVRDVELFGRDIFSALKSASDRTPSKRFKEFLEGFIEVTYSGGNVTNYLVNRSRQYMRLKGIALRRFADTLGILAEFYVTILVAGPLILVVMLAVMAMLGGSSSGLLNPVLLLNLLTYLIIPVGSIVLLVFLDIISPRR